MQEWKYVTKQEFIDFLKEYPFPLVQDFYMDWYSWNDFREGRVWPDSMVAMASAYDDEFKIYDGYTKESLMELKPCPFCGLQAKMHTTYYPSEYADSDDNIPKDAAIMREWRKPKAQKWTVEFRRKAYVPQCTDSTCVGQSQKKFQPEEEAVEAWNKRG